MPLMSEIAFCVLPWPSAYLNSVTLGHLAASSLPEAVVTSRQLLPPKPSSRAKLISFVPHQSGAPSTWVTSPLALSPPLELPPQPVRVSSTAAAAAAAGRILRTFIWTFLPVDTTVMPPGIDRGKNRGTGQLTVATPRSPGRCDQSAFQFTV